MKSTLCQDTRQKLCFLLNKAIKYKTPGEYKGLLKRIGQS